MAKVLCFVLTKFLRFVLAKVLSIVSTIFFAVCKLQRHTSASDAIMVLVILYNTGKTFVFAPLANRIPCCNASGGRTRCAIRLGMISRLDIVMGRGGVVVARDFFLARTVGDDDMPTAELLLDPSDLTRFASQIGPLEAFLRCCEMERSTSRMAFRMGVVMSPWAPRSQLGANLTTTTS